jgi:MFS family permease
MLVGISMRVCAAYSTGPVGGVSPRKRPLGLWVLAILIAIGSINNVSSGVTSLSLGQIGWAVYNLLFGVVGFLASIFMIAGRYYVFVLGYVIAGLLAGLVVSGLVFASLSESAGPEEIGEVIGAFLITAIISLVIYLVIIWYLRRPHVKAFFGKVPPLPAPPPAGIPPTPPSPQAQTALCPTCGAQLQYVPQYQRYWCPREQRYV